MKLKRDLLEYLKKWRDEPKRKPILLKGARQVGKSWMVKELGRSFDNYVEINFEKTPEICSFFAGNIDSWEITKNLANYFGVTISPGNTLLFLDEIQGCPRAILALRYFYEDFPDLHVIAAGSLLEFELRKISVPVGRITIIYVYPLSFSEYLSAAGKDNLRKMLLENKFEPLPQPIHQLLLKEIRDFTILGGMPEVVADFMEHEKFERCQDLQSSLIETYRSDFLKYAKRHQVKYLDRTFASIPLQLGDKFKYVNIARDIKSRELSEALEMLEMAGIVYKVYHSSANGIPLKSEVDPTRFKVLFFDIGLALRVLRVDHRPLLLNPDIGLINNGAIAELLTGLELTSYQNFREPPGLFYWHREAKSSNAEVDYVIALGGEIVPVEVKSGTSGSMKSLQFFLENKKRSLGIKISELNFSLFDQVRSIPFYAIEALLKTSGQ